MMIGKDIMTMAEQLSEFLQQSNEIENVFDSESLDQAMYAWAYIIAEDSLNTFNIKKTHKILMNNQPLAPNQRGYWRDHDVVVTKRVMEYEAFDAPVFRTRVIKNFPHYRKVPKLMLKWIEDNRNFFNGDMTTDLILRSSTPEQLENAIKRFHVEFENIHPFADGNGRVGRILLNWQRVKLGLPVLVIKADERAEYYKWFKK